ncbi:unnamed protein product, partial [Polarella glacialis]
PGWIENQTAGSALWNVKWCTTDCDDDYRSLQDGDLYNHFQHNRELTTKVGLQRSLQLLACDEKVDIDSFFPRSYDLSLSSEREDFILDFRRSAAVNVLRHHERLRTTTPDEKSSLTGYMFNVDILRMSTSILKQWLQDLDGSFFQEEHEPQLLGDIDWDALVCYSQLSTSQLCGCRGLEQVEEGVFRRRKRGCGYTSSGDAVGGTQEQKAAAAPWTCPEFASHCWLASAGSALGPIEAAAHAALAQLESKWPQGGLQGPMNAWIVKPGTNSKGYGIECMQSLPEILHHCTNVGNRVVQKYIERPLLLFSGRKFDIRQWVLVKSFQPLKAYMYSECYLRLCNNPFDLGNLSDRQSHISNWEINKGGRHVTDGAVASLCDFQSELAEITGRKDFWEQELQPKVGDIILKCLRAVQHKVVQRILGRTLNFRAERRLDAAWRRVEAQQLLQRLARGFLGRLGARRRRHVVARRRSALLIQRWVRRSLSRFRAIRRRRGLAAVALQCTARSFLASISLRQLWWSRVATNLQTAWRGYLGRLSARALRQQRAVVKIQRAWLAWARRRRTRERLAAARLQRAARHWHSERRRKRFHQAVCQGAGGLSLAIAMAKWRRRHELAIAHEACQAVQLHWRAYRVQRRKLLSLCNECMRSWQRRSAAAAAAALQVQRWLRGMWARLRAARCCEAAEQIQAAWRARRARRARQQSLRRAACRLQRRWRALRRRRNDESNAAVLLQAFARGMLARKDARERRRFLKLKEKWKAAAISAATVKELSSALLIQAAWRGLLGRRSAQLRRRFLERRSRWHACLAPDSPPPPPAAAAAADSPPQPPQQQQQPQQPQQQQQQQQPPPVARQLSEETPHSALLRLPLHLLRAERVDDLVLIAPASHRETAKRPPRDAEGYRPRERCRSARR